jgi:hypothetical protein
MDDLTKVKTVTRWVIDTANEAAGLMDQALIGSTAGFVALAFLVLNLFWVPAAIFGSIVAYRILQHLLNRRGFESLSEREQFGWVVEEKRRIWSDENLPIEQKEILSGILDKKLGAIDVPVKRLELTSAESTSLERPRKARTKTLEP